MRTIILLACICISSSVFSQDINKIISSKEATRIESVLASDSLQGRKIFTAGIDKAAEFINAEFKKAGLQTINKQKDFRQQFIMLKPTLLHYAYTINNAAIAAENVVVITSKKEITVTEKSGFEKATIAATDNFSQKAGQLLRAGKDYIVFVDSSFKQYFARLTFYKKQIYPSNSSIIFVLGTSAAQTFNIQNTHSFDTMHLQNVVGEIRGKTKPNEYVIFSAHYDHLGIGKPVNGDSIYNGANDDAAGTTAVIMLANYFKKLNNNNRTIIFAAFTGEESGGFGSQYFSKQFDPAQVIAMFNIEMIGTTSKWGTNSAYITGYDKSDMGKILQKNLQGSSFTFYADPYTEQNLFYRSDNATLARLGVPAHTISTSKMDSEPNYHKVSDEIQTLDLDNMAEIVKSIAISSKTIISGEDTPSRVDTTNLK